MGGRIAELRVAQGLTQAQLARKLNVNMRHLQTVELGEANLTLGSITRFAHTLKVEPAELFERPASRVVKSGRPKKG